MEWSDFNLFFKHVTVCYNFKDKLNLESFINYKIQTFNTAFELEITSIGDLQLMLFQVNNRILRNELNDVNIHNFNMQIILLSDKHKVIDVI